MTQPRRVPVDARPLPESASPQRETKDKSLKGSHTSMATANAASIWNIANKLGGPYQPNQYDDVILPCTILRRLDAILAPTRGEVPAAYSETQSVGLDPAVLITPLLLGRVAAVPPAPDVKDVPGPQTQQSRITGKNRPGDPGCGTLQRVCAELSCSVSDSGHAGPEQSEEAK
jgi:hypothetical protein